MSVVWKLVDQGRGPGEARLVESDGDRAVVEASEAFPTGATLCALDPDNGQEYRIKVRSGRRLDERWFRVEGRFVSLTREQRQRLLDALAGGPS